MSAISVVLILIVVEDGLVRIISMKKEYVELS